MSEYQKTENVKELTKRLQEVRKEKEPLETLENTLLSEIKDELRILGDTKYAYLYKETKTLVDLEELEKNFKNIFPFIVAEIDENITLKIMYENHIDYGVAKKMLAHAIEKSKFSEETYERVKIKK